MASLNVAEWSPDQVAEWLKGLGGPVESYAAGLRARGLSGTKLLMLRCDDLEYLGMHVIGHQELLLEAVEQLRNFQYEVSRECVQQLALRVSVAAGGLARALAGGGAARERLETQALLDVARAVQAVKALVCWLARWPLGGGAGLRARAGALLALCLEAATCAQRDRFAEQPARAVAAAAAAAATVADHIIQDVADPLVLAPASLDAVTLRQRGKPLGFSVVPSLCGHLQLAAIRFGSPAHASGAVHEGDEIVQVGAQCVVGWSGAAVERLCAARGAQELQLRLRRRGARPVPALPRDRKGGRGLEPLSAAREALVPAPEPEPDPAGDDSEDSEPLSPPASPTLPLDHTRMYPPKPRLAVQRRHTVSGGSPAARRPSLGMRQFWRELRRARTGLSPEPAHDAALYRRDKAVSCGAGLELTVRPRTCPPREPAVTSHAPAPDEERSRGKLDKAHSTPAYDFDRADAGPGPLVTQIIPESPTTPTDSPAVLVHSAEKADQILDFKKSSSQIEEAILQQKNRRLTDERNEFVFGEGEPAEHAEAVNRAVRRASDADGDGDAREDGRGPESPAPLAFPSLRAVRAPPAPPARPAPRALRLDPSQISVPLRHLTALDLRVPRPASPPGAPGPAAPGPGAGPSLGAGFPGARDAQHSPGAPPPSRGIFPAYKSKSLKKKNSLLAKRRQVPAQLLAARGAGGAAWQRVRARHARAPRWARRHLLLHDATLYAYRHAAAPSAACMIRLPGFTAAPAPEVKSRPHAFKVYHTGTAFYFSCESAEAARAWLDLITRATHDEAAPQAADLPKQYSETEYSSESDGDERAPPAAAGKERDKDKSKFGSLKKLTHRMQRSESTETVGAASLDRKYLRFFSRSRHKDDGKGKSKQAAVPVPTEHYRSYRRVSPVPAPPAAPKPHNYIHASNPNLLDFEQSDFVARPPARAPPRRLPDTVAGFVTLEEFMLKKQEEERRQVYTNRVLLGVERGGREARESSLRRRLERVVPDVLYGALADPPPPPPPPPPPRGSSPGAAQARSPPARPARARADLRPVSVRGRDGYEKIVYTEEPAPAARARRASPSPPERRRDSLRRNDKVHSGARRVPPPADAAPAAPAAPAAAGDGSPGSAAGAGPGVSRLRLMFGRGAARDAPRQEPPAPSAPAAGAEPGSWARRTHHYPHLQCPPTFQPETYSLASRLPPPRDQHH